VKIRPGASSRNVSVPWIVRQPTMTRPTAAGTPTSLRLESRVTELVDAQTRVDFEPTQRRGRLAFSFHSLEELQGLLERLGHVDD